MDQSNSFSHEKQKKKNLYSTTINDSVYQQLDLYFILSFSLSLIASFEMDQITLCFYNDDKN
ncbi:hypothetical protein BpHYR1_027257 [Brachionus plicatilis]|uniref:Uncharacterized protein n=1 Tax=Brachionus plicatilis TaxID=10195 RepID=A0A3M7P659_BRAPC|nr:hypothetical protein BpHYR1_027257 [Brachionus plicatilis]